MSIPLAKIRDIAVELLGRLPWWSDYLHHMQEDQSLTVVISNANPDSQRSLRDGHDVLLAFNGSFPFLRTATGTARLPRRRQLCFSPSSSFMMLRNYPREGDGPGLLRMNRQPTIPNLYTQSMFCDLESLHPMFRSIFSYAGEPFFCGPNYVSCGGSGMVLPEKAPGRNPCRPGHVRKRDARM